MPTTLLIEDPVEVVAYVVNGAVHFFMQCTICQVSDKYMLQLRTALKAAHAHENSKDHQGVMSGKLPPAGFVEIDPDDYKFGITSAQVFKI